MPRPEPDRPRPASRSVRRNRSGPGRADDAFDAAAANVDKEHKLRRDALRRRARAHALELRHSDHGYALVDAARKRLEERNDLTLDEVATHLDAVESARP